MENYEEFFSANRDIWNQRTSVHKESDFYDVKGFLAGKEILTPIELSEVGDVTGKTLLHLQCHFGLDSLAWSRHGAIVTGVDFSEEAIEEAKRLAETSNQPASFVCCNVYDTPLHLPQETFDIVFTSYGVIGWLPDLDKWASVIRMMLNDGGSFYMAEFHPVLWMFDDDFTTIKYAYNNSGVIITDSDGTYTDRYADIQGKEYGWNHGLSEVFNALKKNGLQVEQFNEYSYSPYECFRNMVPAGEGKWHIKGLEGKLPMVYSLSAR